MKVALILPAAGSGERLGRGMPKALVEIDGVPLVRVTLGRLAEAATFVETIVLAPPSDVAAIEAAIGAAPDALGTVRVVCGGATRQQSVATGCAALSDAADVVCIHDAARPLVSRRTVLDVLHAAFRHGAATAASRPSDSVREDRGDGCTVARDRSKYWLVETPQAFRRSILKKAHEAATAADESYTDDASLVEASGQPIHVVETKGRNLKVTIGADLNLAAELLRAESETARPAPARR